MIDVIHLNGDIHDCTFQNLVMASDSSSGNNGVAVLVQRKDRAISPAGVVYREDFVNSTIAKICTDYWSSKDYLDVYSKRCLVTGQDIICSNKIVDELIIGYVNDVGNHFGTVTINNDSLTVEMDNGDEVFKYDSPAEFLVDWEDTMIEEDAATKAGRWRDVIDMVGWIRVNSAFAYLRESKK